jgi:hypothetical protein
MSVAGLAGAMRRTKPPRPRKTYFERDGGLWRTVQTREGATAVPLTNFTAAIVGEEIRHDGLETTRALEIAAKVNSHQGTFTVPAGEFAGMTWIARELGGQALLYPGQGTKDHARFAIQVLSPEYSARRVFTHTGWREIDGAPAYLHGGGAIGPDGPIMGIETALGGELERFALPPPGDPRASLQLLDLAPLEITAFVLALIYRAPIMPSDITGWLVGPTGVFKSELAALAQQHFAPGMDARHLVGWHSTANSIEALAFSAKEAILVVDDFAPSGTSSDVQRLHGQAARVIRAQGNRSGRGRLRPDATHRPTKPPRCTILGTGEDIPIGQSIRARMFISEIAAGDIDQARLTAAQAAAGTFSGAMAAYIAWLAEDLDGRREQFRQYRERLCREIRTSHRRTAWMASELGAALRMHLQFAAALDLWPDCWGALLRTAKAQEEHQLSEDPARRFMAIIGALLTSRQAHLGSAHDPDVPPADDIAGQIGWHYEPDLAARWRPQGHRIGWLASCNTIVYLDPETAYAAAQRFASGQGQALGVGSKTLWKRLAAANLLAVKDADSRNTTKVVIGTERRRVIAVTYLEVSYVPGAGQSGQLG